MQQQQQPSSDLNYNNNNNDLSVKTPTTISGFEHDFLKLNPAINNNLKNESRTKLEKSLNNIYEKSNVLLLGPTGCGKTLLVKSIAKLLNVPFSMSDATPLTQAGYVGEDAEVVILRLLMNSDFDVNAAERGIIFIDEIDKLGRKTDALSNSKDVGGEGVQQALLRMLEGTLVTVNDKSNMSKRFTGSIGGEKESFTVDTSNILFIVSGAFCGLERIVTDRLKRKSIGFNSIVEKDSIKTNILHKVEPSDLTRYGLIPEFVGRLPVTAVVDQLSDNDMVRVLTEPKNSLIKQYEGLFKINNIVLKFTQKALNSIAKEATSKNTGARGLRRIMESVLLDPMYEGPHSNARCIVITQECITSGKEAKYFYNDKDESIIKIMESEENTKDIITAADNTVSFNL